MLSRYGPWVAWGLVLWSVLKISDLPLTETHSICGVWGCGPPTQALIACHAAWLVILAPVACLLPIRMSAFHSRLTGWILIVVGILAVIGLGVHESLTWLPTVPDSIKPYFGRRWVFSIVTLTDVPILQVSGLGVLFVLLGREPTPAIEGVGTADMVALHEHHN